MTSSRYPTVWETAIEALERAERLHRQFFRLAGKPDQVPVWEPPIEVFEHEGRLSIVVALPGVPPDGIDVSLEPGLLVVVAERKFPGAIVGGAVHCLEIPYGRFERRIRLPAGHFRLARRDSEHGCLLLAFERLE